ncbi:MAG: hypothetical protein ACRDKT_09325 [Actinomycetota bacterium]
MRRTIGVLVMLGLVVGALGAPPAVAKRKKKKKPVPVTLYFHGTEPLGEMQLEAGLAGSYPEMNATEPADPAPKSMALVAAGAGGNGTPNPQCAGSPLFPLWQGDVSGTIVGDVKASLDVVSLPATKVDVRLWGIVPPFGACDSQGTEAYLDPAAEVRVDVPPGAGTIEAVFKNVRFVAEGKLLIQYTPILEGVTGARVLYDSTSTTSQIEFTCIPASGTSCT